MDTAFPLATALLGRPDVTGVLRSAFRYRGGERVREDCIAVGVKKKLPVAELQPGEAIPTQIGNVATDVVELNPRLSLYAQEYPVACGGISISNRQGTAGTLGAVFFDETNGIACGLTNFHVLAEGLTQPDAYVVHPGLADGGADDGPHRIGATTRWQIDEWGDAAIFTLSRTAALSVLDTHVILTDVAMPELLDPVEKVGRTTGATQGVVSALGYITIDYSAYGQGSISVYCAAISPVSDPDELITDSGDSGSVWYSPSSGAGLALHIAHALDPVTAYGCILGYVLTDLNCSLLPAHSRAFQRSGSMSQSQQFAMQRTGSFNVIQGQASFVPKAFVIQDSETTYATFDEWAVAQGYPDTATFLEDLGYETKEDFIAAFWTTVGGENVSLYEDEAAFLEANKVKSLKDLMADSGVTFA